MSSAEGVRQVANPVAFAGQHRFKLAIEAGIKIFLGYRIDDGDGVGHG